MSSRLTTWPAPPAVARHSFFCVRVRQGDEPYANRVREDLEENDEELRNGIAVAAAGIDARIGAVSAIIATPDWVHAEQSIACMEAGLDVYCEKEMSNSLEEARRMVEASRNWRGP